MSRLYLDFRSGLFLSGFQKKVSVVYSFCSAHYMAHPSYTARFDCPSNIEWRLVLKFIKHLIMQYILPKNILLKILFSDAPNLCLSLMWETRFQTQIKQRHFSFVYLNSFLFSYQKEDWRFWAERKQARLEIGLAISSGA
jgi:hypothetical protein